MLINNYYIVDGYGESLRVQEREINPLLSMIASFPDLPAHPQIILHANYFNPMKSGTVHGLVDFMT